MAEETQNETTEPVDAPEVEATIEAPADELKPHPAHEKLLSELPEAWHQKVLPHLQEQDKYFQQKIEKYAPYDEFIEAGVSPDTLRGGINLAKAIESQPMDVYESLTTYLKQQGLISEDAKQAAKEIMEDESGEDFDEIFDGEKLSPALKRELDELKNFQKQQQEYQYNQQLEKETQTELTRLEADMTKLKGQYALTEGHEVAIYDIMNAALNAGREVTLEDAAKQLASMIPGGFQALAGNSTSEPAPTIIGSAGGAGIQAQNLDVPKGDLQKKEMLEKMFEQYKKSGQI
jgi:hypothetical protein|tara:strand:+ start:3113 stop:3982 length:870 start_codon:yes stop_codon:yes gene_type:complete